MLVALGAAIVAIMLLDVFQSVIVPRATGRHFRLSAYVSRYGWYAWRSVARTIADDERRQEFLAVYAPLSLVTLLVLWVLGLVIGYALMFYALRADIHTIVRFSDAMYFAGTCLLTLGFGDIAPRSDLTRAITIISGASGFGTVAVVTTFLFSTFGAFQAREVVVVAFSARAGAPPSGVEMLENAGKLGMLDSLQMDFREAQRWMAAVLESHLAYPILTYFRSSHPRESWVATLGAIMDAGSLLIACVDEGKWGEARVMHSVGRTLVADFTRYFSIHVAEDEVGIDRAEFDIALGRLKEAGYTLHEPEAAWVAFGLLRAQYAPAIDALATYWRIPPALWLGSRTRRRHLEAPAAETARNA